eukprot:m.211727 g.211727  ORF g.211727 m.211727 type:complete len:243 (+) comp17154_c0_seq1:1218-1946(+)
MASQKRSSKRSSTAAASTDNDAEQPGAKAPKAQAFSSAAMQEDTVRRACRYILFRHAAGKSFSRTDINNLVGQGSKQTSLVLTEASDLLENTFGFKVQELPKGEDKKNPTEPRVQSAKANTRPEIGTSKTYVLVNKLKSDSLPSVCDWVTERVQMGVTMTILAEIFLRKNTLPVGELWKFLAELGLGKSTEHPKLGPMTAFVDLLVAEKYCHCSTQLNRCLTEVVGTGISLRLRFKQATVSQ